MKPCAIRGWSRAANPVLLMISIFFLISLCFPGSLPADEIEDLRQQLGLSSQNNMNMLPGILNDPQRQFGQSEKGWDNNQNNSQFNSGINDQSLLQSENGASVIEKSYRLQYSSYLRDQLGLLDHVKEPKLLEKPAITGSEASEKLWQEYKKQKTLEELLTESIEKQFTQFGYDLFNHSTQKQKIGIVVPDNYIVGPGDELRLNIWGSGPDIGFSGMVAADGTIVLPRLGIIPVGGLKYSELNEVIRQEATKYVQGINLHVTIVRPRNFEVYVTGQVKLPGLRLVPAFSTVLNALSLAGGPLKVGTLRKISIYRNGKLYSTMDLYQTILNGIIRNDILLEDKDVIHVPYIGPTVAVVGAVRRPGIFELKDNYNIKDIIDLSGGTLAQAQLKLNLRRYANNQSLSILDIDLDKIKSEKMAVQDGDLLEIRYIKHDFPTAIRVTGHIFDEIEIEFKEGMMLSQVMPDKEKLKPGSITDFAILERFDTITSQYSKEKIPLKKVWAGKFDLPLLKHDKIIILSREEFGITQLVHLRGAVWMPDNYEYFPGMDLSSLLALAGGVKNKIAAGFIEISRQEIIANEIKKTHFRLPLNDSSLAQELKPFDFITVARVKDAGIVHEVEITGEVKYPGKFALKKGERISDLITRAGGFLSSAYLYGTGYYSEEARIKQQESVERLINQLEIRGAATKGASTSQRMDATIAAVATQTNLIIVDTIAKLRTINATGRVTIELVELSNFKDSAYDFQISHLDRIHIPVKPAFISIVGSVYAPNSYLYKSASTLGDYLNLAGGITKTGDNKHLSLLKMNGQVIGQTTMSRSRFLKLKLMPGDTIVVPENLERLPGPVLYGTIADIFYKITISLGVIAGYVF